MSKVIASVSELPSAVEAVLDDLTRYQKHAQEINNQAVFEVVASLVQIMPQTSTQTSTQNNLISCAARLRQAP